MFLHFVSRHSSLGMKLEVFKDDFISSLICVLVHFIWSIWTHSHLLLISLIVLSDFSNTFLYYFWRPNVMYFDIEYFFRLFYAWNSMVKDIFWLRPLVLKIKKGHFSIILSRETKWDVFYRPFHFIPRDKHWKTKWEPLYFTLILIKSDCRALLLHVSGYKLSLRIYCVSDQVNEWKYSKKDFRSFSWPGRPQ